MAFSFGAPAAAPAAGATSTPFSFGSTPAAWSGTAAPAPGAATTTLGSGGGLFGAASKPATTTPGGLFGSAAAAPAAGTSLFGSAATGAGTSQSAAAPATSAPASTPFSLFGSKPAAATTTVAPATTAAPALGSSLFGAKTTAPAATGTSLFGAKPATTAPSLFGQPQAQQQTATAGATVAPGTQQQQQQSQQAQAPILSPASQQRKLGPPLSAQLTQIYQAWNTSDLSTCLFVYYFYNNVGQDAVQALLAQTGGQGWGGLRMMELLRRRDALGPMHDELWAAAVRQNPDPSRLVPILAVGYPDLAKRRTAQQAESERIAAALASTSKRTDDILKAHSLGNAARLQAAQRRQTLLHARILGLARRYWRLLESGKAGLVNPGSSFQTGGLLGAASLSSSVSGLGVGAGVRAGASLPGGAVESAELQRQDERTREILESCNAVLNGAGPSANQFDGGSGEDSAASLLPWGNAFSSFVQAGGGGGGALRFGGGADNGPPLVAKLAELWPKVANLSARRAEKHAGAGHGGSGAAQPASWAVVDEEGVEQIAQILASQQAGLAHLTQVLNQDKAVISVLAEMLKGVRVVAA